MQDEIARLVPIVCGREEAPFALAAEERAAIAESRAAAARGDFATDNEVRAVWAKHNLADLETVLGDISSHSPKAAVRVQLRIRTFVELLKDYPFIGARTDDPSIRRLSIPPYPYLIFYEVVEDVVVIHAVRHAARDPSSMPGSR